MTDVQMLTYVFAAFLAGAISLGAAFVLGLRRDDHLARAFLFFYLPFTLLVLTALVMAATESVTSLSARVAVAVDYLESFPGRYAIMLALPLFTHRVFAVRKRGRETVLVVGVLLAFAVQHVTEFALGGVWDRVGDLAEDVLFATVVAYAVAVAFRRRDHAEIYQPVGRRFVLLLLLGIPVAGHDIFVADGPGLRVYPLWYSLLGLTMVVTLVRRSTGVGAAAPAEWGLSPREEEVLELVCRGLTNRQIAVALTISENTVKTHVRAIYGKSCFRSRVSLIASLARRPPAGDGTPSVTGELPARSAG